MAAAMSRILMRKGNVNRRGGVDARAGVAGGGGCIATDALCNGLHGPTPVSACGGLGWLAPVDCG